MKALRAVLPKGVDLVAVNGEQCHIEVNGHRLNLRWIGDGRLAVAREAIEGRTEPSDCLVVAARELSPGAKDVLSANGIGWVDETGAAEIVVGMIVVSRSGTTPHKPARPPRWTPSVKAAAEAMLCGTPATVSAIQMATGLSSGSCTNALRSLTELRILERETSRGPRSGRRVADQGALLGAYAQAVNNERHLQVVVGVLWRDPLEGLAELGLQWSNAGLAWATTGAAASSILAPILTAIESVVVYVDSLTIAGLESAARSVDLKPMDGGRLTLRPFPTPTTQRLSTQVGDLNVAPWPRVYADLQMSGVRGEQAAEHLREAMTNGG